MQRRVLTLVWGWVVALGVAPLAAAEPSAAVDYTRQIRAILSNNCFFCHGPDEAERKAGLRLDRRDAALAPGESGSAPIVPGKPDESELVARIESADDELRMPPPATGKTLSAEQKRLLREWIAQGAEYREHWAFVAPQRPEPPAVQNASWPRNEIDRFVLARLEAGALAPAAEADRATLVRRLTLDLTGLPPTPEEVDRFVADERPDAYEQLVARLLESPHYGERMALEWLDAARFADTHGYHIDSGRDMTRWREWVIEAFNTNLPFDRFTIDQLAGDLVPNATLEQQVASGFNRNHMINFEGGAIPDEYHNAYIVDRVNTTGAVWLGLSVGCGQCHDHKYDPISQREFYQLYAFFHQVKEKGLDGNFGNAQPLVRVPTPEQHDELERIDQELAAIDRQFDDAWAEVDAAQAAWETAFAAGAVAWQVLTPTRARAESGANLALQDDQSLLATGENPATEVYELVVPAPQQPLTAIRLEALTDPSLVDGGPGRSANANFVLSEFQLETAPAGAADAAPQAVALAAAEADYSQQDYDIALAIDGKLETGWAVDGGTKHENRTAYFYPTAPLVPGADTELRIRLRFASVFGQHAIGRLRLAMTSAVQPRASQRPPDAVVATLAKPIDQRTPEQAAQLRRWYRQHVSPEGQALDARRNELRELRKQTEKRVRTAMVMNDDQPRDTFILMRGQYDKPGEKVSPGVPAALPPLPAGAPANRLGLAQWLVDPSHPLVARVIVNRYWQMYFGTGLVKTSEDFGSQGELPSHPELLDWLATEFIRSGWDVKHMQRLIVQSATYRQSSRVAPDAHRTDPENRLLARASRLRLPAEFIRDQALAASGLLDPRIGGASVSPYQPAGLWEELASREDGKNWTAQEYTQSHGSDLYRRTMYTFWKRTSPPPTLATFDAPDRETCTVRRARTNTPLQALILMNDPTYVEASRKLAERLLTEAGPGVDDRLALAFRLATARRPDERELAVLRRVLDEQLVAYRSRPEAAEELLHVGESAAAPVDPVELAAWSVVCSMILNLDETVTRG
ncbi:MAG: PSD1 and planctomycete cytochrome C domain-containing protein [Pirellulales bacterium]|nr:PSD1 and planctomycete cytochrome C domain-containing protein [Pirellulales bacterium]